MSESKPSSTGSKSQSKSANDEVSGLTYEQALAELESIIARIESGDVPLEESLRQYRHGADLVRRCREVLESARAEIERIAVVDLIARPDSAITP